MTRVVCSFKIPNLKKFPGQIIRQNQTCEFYGEIPNAIGDACKALRGANHNVTNQVFCNENTSTCYVFLKPHQLEQDNNDYYRYIIWSGWNEHPHPIPAPSPRAPISLLTSPLTPLSPYQLHKKAILKFNVDKTFDWQLASVQKSLSKSSSIKKTLKQTVIYNNFKVAVFSKIGLCFFFVSVNKSATV